MRIMLLVLCAFACGVSAAVAQAQSTPAESTALIELTDQNFAAWRSYLTPTAKELAWEQIPWLPSFAEGVVAADRRRKPLLLWLMNGHPLGCT